MLARIWHGVTSAEKADEYLDYLNRTGMPDYRATRGNCGAFVLRRVDGELAHFLTLSLWDSLESIKRFAGNDYERARYYAEDGEFLLEFEPTVQHYEYYANANAIQGTIDELKNIHDGDAWHGPSLKEILSGVTAEQAAARPLANAHSIWELMLHIAAWEGVFLRRLAGQALEEPEEGDFPPVTDASEDAWRRTLTRFDETHRSLVEAIAGLTDERLRETVAGKDYTVEYLLRGMVRHHVYHAGQIALLKKAKAEDVSHLLANPRAGLV